ncbi:MAG: hypothetical protein HQK49_04405 [Oligoflexia bacterium]|nr:hypothetical protein [Oligoflexia bacterium]
MLYKNSTHPIEVKKIPLKIWTLRAHLESFIKKYVKNIEYDYVTPDELTALFKLYFNESFLLEHFPNLLQNFSIPPIVKKNQSSEEDDEGEDTLRKQKNKQIDEQENEQAIANASIDKDQPNNDQNDNQDKFKENKSELDNKHNNNRDDDYDDDDDDDLLVIPLRPPIDKEHLARGKTFISDITMKRISFFGTKGYLPGQAIIIEFDVPNNFTISAEVLHCENYNLHSRIISENRPKHRIHATFPFARKGERTMLRNFIKSIETQIKK